MSYDTIASLQRMQQLEQAQAAAGKRLVLQRDHKTDNIHDCITTTHAAIRTSSGCCGKKISITERS
ncbi:hypothetical protein [Bacillus thuringiensis]|uniref:hypothetical protein n=1 Tax=Bacillus thuringiensis TaxID=1428 RepID=UPI000AEFCC2F|nr:hypothetical protein [Bacillus thuringiensis]